MTDPLFAPRQWNAQYKKRRGAILTCPECGHTGAKVLAVDHYRDVPAETVKADEYYILHCKCEQCQKEFEVKM